MHVPLPRLLLLLLLITPPSESSRLTQHSSDHHLRDHDRHAVLVEKRLLKAELPDKLKDWQIFQDGNPIREGVRSKYASALRYIDKIKEPYSFAKGIKKEWRYEPDLRRHYFLPRVLRVPLILQDGPFRYKKELTGFIKGTDEDLGLQTVAKPHLPEMAEEQGDEAAQSKAGLSGGTEHDDEMSVPSGSRRPGRRPRTRRFERQPGFNPFRQVPGQDLGPPRHPVPEIESDDSAHLPWAGGSQSTAESRRPSDGDRQPSLDQQSAGQARIVEPLSNAFVGMGDRYRTLQNFQEEQIRKAAMRYSGHPEHIPSGQQDGGSMPSRSAPVQAPTPEQSHKHVGDPAEADADVSNPITPDLSTPGSFTPEHARMSPGWARSPELRTPLGGDPSPRVSTPGAMTPHSQPGTGGHTPLSMFRLPVDYAEQLQAARARLEQEQLSHEHARPSVAPATTFGPKSSSSASVGWYAGQPSPEAQRNAQEAAQWNDVDYAIYHPDPFRHAKISAAKVYPLRDQEMRSGTVTPSIESETHKSEEDGSGRESRQGAEGTANAPQSIERDLRKDEEMKDVSPSSGASAPPSAPAAADVEPPSHIDETTSSDVPAKKRKRPPKLQPTLKRVQSFLFPTATEHTELTSPHLRGFKPSLSIKEEPNPDFDPTDPRSSPGLVFRRYRLAHSSKGSVQKGRHRLQRLPSFETSRESTTQESRDGPSPR
ncbi:hypothetical protein PSEUBRA_003087 [Kalmanozyma brasiliensis GHG001]|uniref:uncharacterized protein n=1 Tax=Kalmanozyma brasiliensis (strain GHG001) TaxID=1365824 RepID=UPI0028681029|nr:uncharacterized protein PSEUBRA_003087 [Kalmanozyma brasiliensis GHG001]KAF6767182.1 hypothetical protein PSEUBRA_003087 [Kalmanozyma brasiliensis GHG001]